MTMYPHIVIAWSGLPLYAAHLIRAGIEKIGEPVAILGNKPKVPIVGLEEVLGSQIIWLNPQQPYKWKEIDIPVPEFFIHTGWNVPSFNSLAKEVRLRGGKVVAMIDNSWKNTPKQLLGSIIFRAIYIKRFDAVWVPGTSGFQLCSFLGMQPSKIYRGLYSASTDIFHPGLPLSDRGKVFLFVGQFIERKGVDLLVKAFNKFQSQFPDWKLHVIGCGNMRSVFDHNPTIFVEDFQQSPYIAEAMRQSRFLILPSLVEHWGVVLHEATLSGCGIISNRNVGASLDLLSEHNGVVFKAGSMDSLYQAMVKAALFQEPELVQIFNESLRLSSMISLDGWAETFVQIITDLRNG